MKITVIYGTQKKSKSSTYNIAQQFINQLSEADAVTEFFLPESMPKFCTGCRNCFRDHTKCPDYLYLKPILESMLGADLLIFTAPVYVSHVPGQVKAFLDHFGYQTMAHHPRNEMFCKQALLISTAAGGGTSFALKDLKDSLTYWGVARIHAYGVNVHSGYWDTVDDKIKTKIKKKAGGISTKIKAMQSNVKPSLRVKSLFYFMRFVFKIIGGTPKLGKMGFTIEDEQYWHTRGWLGKARPW